MSSASGTNTEEPFPHVPTRQWTTHRAGTEQFALWQDAVDTAFVPVTIADARPDRSRTFAGEVAARRFGPVQLADIASDAQSVVRSRKHIERVRGDVFFLNLPMSEGSAARQAGRATRLHAHDFVVLDGDQPFALDFDRPFRQLSLSLPRDVLESRLLHPLELTARRTPGDTGIGCVASAAIRAAASASPTLDARSAAALGEQLVDLVALALGGLRPQRDAVSSELLFESARAQIERRLTDVDLAPQSIAHDVGVSVRYLHRLFSDQGVSFGRWVLARRLSRARALLADPDQAHTPIAAVASLCGFADPSYFARVFKSVYGGSPSAVRACLLVDGPTNGSALSS